MQFVASGTVASQPTQAESPYNLSKKLATPDGTLAFLFFKFLSIILATLLK
jgi:hypothetical protein